jgi:hypothetical protein
MPLTVPPLTYRLVKGSPLTFDEGDANLGILRDFCNALAAVLDTSLNPDGTLKPGAITDRSVTQPKLAFGFNMVGPDVGGSANNYALDVQPYPAAYALGMVFYFIAANDNTGASTFKLKKSAAVGDFLAAKSIVKLNNAPLDPGDIKANQACCVIYDSVLDKFKLLAAVNLVGVQANIPSFRVFNGGFEYSAGGIPDRWTRTTLAGGGTGATDTAQSAEGAQSWKCVSLGGAGVGGCELQCNDFLPCDALEVILLSWWMRISTATMHNRVELLWFDKDKVASGTKTIFDVNAGNITNTWTPYQAGARAPATAKFFKIKITGGVLNGAEGTAYFDDIRVVPTHVMRRRVEFNTAATHTWKCPAGAAMARVVLIGGGGGGGGGSGAENPNGGAGGGGGGEMSDSYVPVTVGTTYTIVVGAGGAVSSGGADGNPGADSTFDAGGALERRAKGGGGGRRGVVGGVGAGGTGGTGGTGDILNDGLAGSPGDTGNGQNGRGGRGADSMDGEAGGAGGIDLGAASVAGLPYGSGGGGAARMEVFASGGFSAGRGSAGARGRCYIELF